MATEYDDFRVRSYALAEFHERLVAAGFREIVALKPYEGSPSEEADDAVVFCCRKS
jgi:hypothetical protein